MMKTRKTTEQVIQEATGNLTKGLEDLLVQKDQAITIFSETAAKLAKVNQGLLAHIEKLNDLAQTVEALKNSAKQSAEENEATIQKIMSIIGN